MTDKRLTVLKNRIICLFEFILHLEIGMKRLTGVLCAFLGVILLIGGYVAFWYEVSGGDGLWWSMNPYRYLAFPLIVLGVILIIAGAFLYFYTPKETSSSRTMNMTFMHA